MSKRTQEDAGEARVTAKSKPMMNLVSRCSVRDPNVLASTASESPGETRYESQIPLSSWNEQQPRTGRPVMGASSLKWSSQEWKSGEMLGARTVRPVSGQPAGSFTQHTDRFVIDDDDMGLWHRHRIEPFSKITIILAQGEWSSAKDIGPVFKRCNARITSKELAPIHSVKNGILQNACSTGQKNESRFGEKCSYAHRQVDEQPSKRSEKNGDKSVVAMLKSTRQLGCAFQDMDPPRSSSILRKSSNTRKPIRCVQFTKAVLSHANIRDQSPSLGYICPGDPHQRNPNAPKFEDRSQEEREWQERCAREAAWRLAKNILKLSEKHKTTFFSPSENWCLPAPSTLKTRGKRICCRLRSVDAHDQQKGFEFRWIGNRDDIKKSDDGYNSQWSSADAWRGHSVCQRIGHILDNESPRGYASSFIARKALRWTRILIWMDRRSKTTSH